MPSRLKQYLTTHGLALEPNGKVETLTSLRLVQPYKKCCFLGVPPEEFSKDERAFVKALEGPAIQHWLKTGLEVEEVFQSTFEFAGESYALSPTFIGVSHSHELKLWFVHKERSPENILFRYEIAAAIGNLGDALRRQGLVYLECGLY